MCSTLDVNLRSGDRSSTSMSTRRRTSRRLYDGWLHTSTYYLTSRPTTLRRLSLLYTSIAFHLSQPHLALTSSALISCSLSFELVFEHYLCTVMSWTGLPSGHMDNRCNCNRPRSRRTPCYCRNRSHLISFPVSTPIC